jgi:CubicO group peptidase (beta-lactamase class C family)
MTARYLALQVTLLLLVEVTLAQGPAPSPLLAPAPAASPAAIAPASSPAAELTRTDLEPFLDGLIASQIENRDVAGAVVAVVKDGEMLLSKGYGFADFDARTPVLADETLFRPGSISKVFTAVAVMQLVEQGKLDLDKDVREYLDFEIARKFPEPITLRRILTHTAGFEESVKNLFGSPNEPVKPLREYLVAHMPVQIFRPGTVPAYSNYAIAVAGYIVERIARQPLDQYLAKHVFVPLRMTSSTFTQPLPDALENRMSKGYTIPSKGAKAFEICNPTPAGAMTTTATDMSRFMRALLNGGTLDGATILQPETLALMQSRQFELHPDLHGMGLVFMEYSQDGHVIWGHGGDTVQFHSDMFLIPDARVGLFISYNSSGARPGSGRGELQRAFLARYFPPADAAMPAKTADAAAHAREVVGGYEGSRKSETNIFRITSLLGQQTVTADREGILKIENAKNLRGQLKRWQEVAPYVYHEIN